MSIQVLRDGPLSTRRHERLYVLHIFYGRISCHSVACVDAKTKHEPASFCTLWLLSYADRSQCILTPAFFEVEGAERCYSCPHSARRPSSMSTTRLQSRPTTTLDCRWDTTVGWERSRTV